MTPEPMRGTICTPAHVVFTAAAIADLLGAAPGPDRQALLERIHANTLRFYAPR
jgi:TatD DNase family protein